MRINDNGEIKSWDRLPAEALVNIFKYLSHNELRCASLVCKHWALIVHSPLLWRCCEFSLSQFDDSSNFRRIDCILGQHGKHLHYVTMKIDGSAKSAETACILLARLAVCSLKKLILTSTADSVFLEIDARKFMSALTIALNRSALQSLTIEYAPLDDLALSIITPSVSRTIQHLRINNCPQLSSRGITSLAHKCEYLRDLSLPYSLLSDELLGVLSTEHRVQVETIRLEAHPSAKSLPKISDKAWLALTKHSPNLNLDLLIYLTNEDEFAPLFTSYIPVTHLYFGGDAPKEVLARIGKYSPRLVELVISNHNSGPIDQALVSVAKSCPRLIAIGLGDCELTCTGFIEFVNLCAGRLQQLLVWEESLLNDPKYDVIDTCRKISSLLGRNWAPEYFPVW